MLSFGFKTLIYGFYIQLRKQRCPRNSPFFMILQVKSKVIELNQPKSIQTIHLYEKKQVKIIIHNKFSPMLPASTTKYKLVLIGDSAVGKSSIVLQFTEGIFNEVLYHTIGVDFKFSRVKVGGEDVKLEIWDTAGMESFRSIISVYYNTADAILLCYDISKYISFEHLKDYWVGEALQHNKNNAKLFVIGNKLDCKREVQEYSLEELKNNNNIAGFYEVSAKTNANIQKCFASIAKQIQKDRAWAAKKEAGSKKRLKQPKGKRWEEKSMGVREGEGEKGCCS